MTPSRKHVARMRSRVGGTTILGLGLPESVQREIESSTPHEVHVRIAGSIQELVFLAANTPAPVLLYAIPDPMDQRGLVTPQNADDIHAALRGPLRKFPAVAACYITSPLSNAAQFRGLEHVQLVVMHPSGAVDPLWRALQKALLSSIASELLDSVRGVRSALIRRVMACTLSRVDEDLDIPKIARILFMHERTLRRRLRAEASDVTARELVVWSRLLFAAWHLRQERWSILDVANALDFSAASNLHRQMRRYTGFTLRALRSSDPVAKVASSFVAAVNDRCNNGHQEGLGDSALLSGPTSSRYSTI